MPKHAFSLLQAAGGGTENGSGIVGGIFEHFSAVAETLWLARALAATRDWALVVMPCTFLQVEAITIRLEVNATRVEAIASRSKKLLGT